MSITIEIPENILSVEECKTIIACLGLKETKGPNEVIAKIGLCALLEYKKMFLESGLPTKADEVRQERLFFLIKGIYIESLPTEQQVSTIFQLSTSRSKSLLRNTIASYRNQLRNQIVESVRIVLSDSKQDDNGNYQIAIKSDTIKEEINSFLMQNKPTLQKLTATRGSAGLFTCAEDTYDFLAEAYGN